MNDNLLGLAPAVLSDTILRREPPIFDTIFSIDMDALTGKIIKYTPSAEDPRFARMTGDEFSVLL